MQKLDVLIIGAGISGIGYGAYLSMNCPDKSFRLIETRQNLGGTWDLYKYPGIRSDSDMYTFGYKFKPWNKPKDISPAADILSYLNETVDDFKMRPKIDFQHCVKKANWVSAQKCWHVTVQNVQTGEEYLYEARYVIASTGYYDYEKPYLPNFKGQERFKGDFFHAQLWPDALCYKDKKVVVIGSGATAVTIVPNMVHEVDHVTMLQRSPTYMMSVPGSFLSHKIIKAFLPQKWAHAVIRKKILTQMRLLLWACDRFPIRVRRYLMEQASQHLEGKIDVETHFNPHYNPWEQRLCFMPDGDFFKALLTEKASVVTDHIEAFTDTGIQLKSGNHLEADIIIAATGLNLKIQKHFEYFKDDEPVNTAELFTYKGVMLAGLPNLFPVMGYSGQSWTLKVDLAAQYFCDLLKLADQKGAVSVTPKPPVTDGKKVYSLFGKRLEKASYIKRALDQMPLQLEEEPYSFLDLQQKDKKILAKSQIDDGYLIFE
ncbi:NAD(P)/FAD-dependent oxidoreductase [Temperatibacter marinus]|uniref:NAD(P)/FAD-dependent oxidoreductase n=1 Tax=Temperatibacter marinus TaxID=1456591 RepID=A0AA52EKX8_9PROT|nr:NAD(P)/FAD-dependent oxidoreductase [Temperatibacter marinus]WND03911.1 NAD(P)/FAD-dependent oxidoreductase [Temperatibacter marinus]